MSESTTGSGATAASAERQAVAAEEQTAVHPVVVPAGESSDAGPVIEDVTTRTRPATARPVRRTRKARLRLARVDPWSVMKTAFLFAIAGGIILFVAVAVVWSVIHSSGAIDSINKTVNDLLTTPGAENQFRLDKYINSNKVLGFTAMIAAADVVIFTALATLFSFLYNLAATVLGGLEVTLAED